MTINKVPKHTDFKRLLEDPTLVYLMEDLIGSYAARWAVSEDKPEREYLWFKQNAIAEIVGEIKGRSEAPKVAA